MPEGFILERGEGRVSAGRKNYYSQVSISVGQVFSHPKGVGVNRHLGPDPQIYFGA